MANPLLPPGTQLTESDLLLIIGDQTVTIAVLRQSLADTQTVAQAQCQQLEGALKNMAVERDALVHGQKVATVDKDIESLKHELRQRLSLTATKVGGTD